MIKVWDVEQVIKNAPARRGTGEHKGESVIAKTLHWHQQGFIFVYVIWRPAWQSEHSHESAVIYSDGRVSPGVPPKDAILIGAFQNGGSEYVFHDPDDLIIKRLQEAGIKGEISPVV